MCPARTGRRSYSTIALNVVFLNEMREWGWIRWVTFHLCLSIFSFPAPFFLYLFIFFPSFFLLDADNALQDICVDSVIKAQTRVLNNAYNATAIQFRLVKTTRNESYDSA
ncbi:hypothetical protein CPC08DRAFT_321573 [Agrocybe pediades]|nr:hypothetical protein CPC08DRAFT_321573 [Agrocybe pediades]